MKKILVFVFAFALIAMGAFAATPSISVFKSASTAGLVSNMTYTYYMDATLTSAVDTNIEIWDTFPTGWTFVGSNITPIVNGSMYRWIWPTGNINDYFYVAAWGYIGVTTAANVTNTAESKGALAPASISTIVILNATSSRTPTLTSTSTITPTVTLTPTATMNASQMQTATATTAIQQTATKMAQKTSTAIANANATATATWANGTAVVKTATAVAATKTQVAATTMTAQATQTMIYLASCTPTVTATPIVTPIPAIVCGTGPILLQTGSCAFSSFDNFYNANASSTTWVYTVMDAANTTAALSTPAKMTVTANTGRYGGIPPLFGIFTRYLAFKNGIVVNAGSNTICVGPLP